MALTALVQSVVGFVAIVCIGVALRAAGLVRREDAKPLNVVIIYVGLPAFVFQAVHGARLTVDAFAVVGIAWVVFGAGMALALLAVRALRLNPERAGGFVLAASLGNTGFLGYPLTATLLGAAALPFAVFYDVFGTVLQLVLVGRPLARRFVHESGQGERGSLRDLAMFPALVAAVAALLLVDAGVPAPVGEWLDLIAKMVAPLIMLSVGISLRPHAVAHAAPELALLAVLRLLAGPAVVLVSATLLPLGPGVREVAVMQAGMPSMMLTLAVGERMGLDDDFIGLAPEMSTA